MQTLVRLAYAIIDNWADIKAIFSWMKTEQVTLAEMADFLNPPEPEI